MDLSEQIISFTQNEEVQDILSKGTISFGDRATTQEMKDEISKLLEDSSVLEEAKQYLGLSKEALFSVMKLVVNIPSK